MTRPNPLVLEALDTLKARGFVPMITDNGQKHIKIAWIDHGRKFLLIVSRTPSSRYAERRSRAVLKRLLNGGGHV
jgi:hypothetical protein